MNTFFSRTVSAILLAATVTGSAWSQNPNYPDGLVVTIHDESDTPTNIRTAPKGKVACTIPAYQPFTFVLNEGVMDQNGYVSIAEGAVYLYDEESDSNYSADKARRTLTGSTSGYWIHNSLLEVQTYLHDSHAVEFHAQPSADSPVTYATSRTHSRLHPLRVEGDWLYAKTCDSKHEGWVPMAHILPHPLYTLEEGERANPSVYNPSYYELHRPFYVNGGVGIQSFVDALCLEDEQYRWEDESYEMDARNGYFHFFSEGAGGLSITVAYWKRTDGRILVMLNQRMGEEFCYDRSLIAPDEHQENAWFTYCVYSLDNNPDYLCHTDCCLMAWLYNPGTHYLEPLDTPPFASMPAPQPRLCRNYILPQHGKSIELHEFDPATPEKERVTTLNFNGMGFE